MKTRQQWVAMLAKLTAPMDATRAAKALADMLPMLEDFPDAAFTIASLDAVATKRDRVPTYAELRGDLAGWWKANRPTPIAITADQNSTIKSRQERAEAEASWKNITAEQVRAKIRALDGHPKRDYLGHFLATALSRHARHHLGLLPPPWLADRSEPAQVVALRQPPA